MSTFTTGKAGQQPQHPYGESEEARAAAAREGGASCAGPNADPAMAVVGPSSPKWTTMLGACEEPSSGGTWAMSCLFPCCTAASAKSEADGSSFCYNCMCWNCLSGNNWVRRHYKIDGACGEDMVCGCVCYPCITRRMKTETEVRGQAALLRGGPETWSSEYFGCGFIGFLQALLFPCCVASSIRKLLQPETQKEPSPRAFDCLCIYPCAMWGQTRHMYGLEPMYVGECADDVCLACACYPCALLHAERECKTRFTDMPHLYGLAAKKNATKSRGFKNVFGW